MKRLPTIVSRDLEQIAADTRERGGIRAKLMNRELWAQLCEAALLEMPVSYGVYNYCRKGDRGWLNWWAGNAKQRLKSGESRDRPADAAVDLDCGTSDR